MPRPERFLLHVCHAPADEGWVHGHMLPALGLVEGQYRTRADDVLGELQLAEIERAIEECRVTVVVVSSAGRWDPLFERTRKLALHAAVEAGAPTFIVLTRDVPSEVLSLGERAIVGLDCSDEAQTTQALEKLRAHLELEEPRNERPSCPYPGLEPFTAANGDLLFGRDEERAEILQRIRARQPLILMLGPSGSGKSSLLRSAVIPALQLQDCVVGVVGVGCDLVAALRAAVRTLEIPGFEAALDRYLETVRDTAEAKIEQARVGLATVAVPDSRRRVVVVDSLEKIFAVEDPKRATFFHMLGGLWSRTWCTVILCMRGDFGKKLKSERCWREIDGSQYWLPPRLHDASLRAAIVEPARQVGVHLDPVLVERLVREVDRSQTSAPLPMLQVTLTALWARLRWRYLSLADYEGIVRRERHEDGPGRAQRGIAAVLPIHADRVLQELTEPGDRQLAQRILLDLIHFGEGRPDTRRRRTLRQLRRPGDVPEQLDRVLDKLVEGRLITAGAEELSSATVTHFDLIHDVLIEGWPTLSKWLSEGKKGLLEQRRIDEWLQREVEQRSARSSWPLPRWFALPGFTIAITIFVSQLGLTNRPAVSACERAARSDRSEDDIWRCVEHDDASRDFADLRWAAEAFIVAGDFERARNLAFRLISGGSSDHGFRILTEVTLRSGSGHAGEAYGFASNALAAAVVTGDEARIMLAVLSFSKAARAVGDFDTAAHAADEAVRRAQRLDDPESKMSAHLLAADVFRRVGDLDAAEDASKRARYTPPCTEPRVPDEFGVNELETMRGSNYSGPQWDTSTEDNEACRRLTAAAHVKVDALAQSTDEEFELLLRRGVQAAERGALAEAEDYLVQAERIDVAAPNLQRWKIAHALAELAELRGGFCDSFVAEYHYRRAIKMLGALRAEARTHAAYLISRHRAPYDGFIALLARAGRWQAALAVILELDASDMLRAIAVTRGRSLLLLRDTPTEVAEAPPAVEDVLAAWRSRDLAIVIAPSPRQIGSGRERAYRLRITDGRISGDDIGDAGRIRRSAATLAAEPGDRAAAGELGRVIVPSWSSVSSSEILDVLAIGVLGKVPLAALRDEQGAPLVGRRPLARVLTLRPSAPQRTPKTEHVVLADPRGEPFSTQMESDSVASILKAHERLIGPVTSGPATWTWLWSKRNAELLHIDVDVSERGRRCALALSDGALTPDEIVSFGIAPRLAVVARCGTTALNDEEGWGTPAAALLQAGASTVITAERSHDELRYQSLVRNFYRQQDWRTAPVTALARVQSEAASDPAMNARSWATWTVLRRPPSRTGE